MKNIFEEAFLLQEFLSRNKFQFCFIGGLALQRLLELKKEPENWTTLENMRRKLQTNL